MSLNDKYLREISRSLAGISLFYNLKASAASRKTFNWLKIAALIFSAILVISSPYLFDRLQRTAILHDPFFAAEDMPIPVNKLVRKVQEEISKSEQERVAQGIAPMFEVKTLELEIGFVVKRSSNSGGKITYEVFTVDNELHTGNEQTHRIKLVMDIKPYDISVKPSESEAPTEGTRLESVPNKKGQKQ